MIDLIDFSFGFSANNTLFDKCNLKFKKDKISVIIGDNGSGKTTLCRIISGLERKYSGKILLKNENLKDVKTVEMAKEITFIKQEPISNIVAATPNEDLLIWQTSFRQADDENLRKARKQALKNFSLLELADLPIWEMSFGQKKAIGIIASTLLSHRFLIIDEPLSGLDNSLINKFLSILKEIQKRKSGALIVTHRPKVFRTIGDEFFRIKNKKIVKVKL